jgi:hypothetical protein
MNALPGGVVASGAAGGLLLLLLLLGIRQGNGSGGFDSQVNLPPTGTIGELGPCPSDFVSKIFSESDLTFVSSTGSSELERLLLRERKQVALAWVSQTSAFLSLVIREHVASARSSQNLRITTEVRIVARYGQLMLICGLLSVVIRIAGPFWVRGLALYAQRLCQRTVQVALLLEPKAASGTHIV